eukprot:4466069-Karenia_brevis.AAC.1
MQHRSKIHQTLGLVARFSLRAREVPGLIPRAALTSHLSSQCAPPRLAKSPRHSDKLPRRLHLARIELATFSV